VDKKPLATKSIVKLIVTKAMRVIKEFL